MFPLTVCGSTPQVTNPAIVPMLSFGEAVTPQQLEKMKKNNSVYELVVAAKNAVDENLYDFLDNSGALSPDNLAIVLEKFPEWTAQEIYGRPATRKEQIALRTVITTANWYEDLSRCWEFYMPTTKACIHNYRITAREVAKKRPCKIYGCFASPTWEDDPHYPYGRVDRGCCRENG